MNRVPAFPYHAYSTVLQNRQRVDAVSLISQQKWPSSSCACTLHSGRRHPELGRLRLVVTRDGESDVMTLTAEVAAASEALRDQIAASLRTVTKLGGHADLAAPGSLPNDGKVIADERSP